MAIENQWKQKIIGGVLAGIFLIVGIGMCLSSCQLTAALTENTEHQQSVEKDSYETKILYYETQLKSMTTQLSEMAQQLHIIRSDYTDQLEQLKELIHQYQEEQPGNSTEGEGDNIVPPSDETANQTPNQDPDHAPEQDTSTSTPPEMALNDYTYRLENGCAILTSYLGNEKEIIIPAAVNGYLVVGLGDNMFAETDIVSVILPQTIETIGWFSFYQCKNLKRVVLPSKISTIGYASFDGCPSTLCLYVAEGSYAEQYAVSFGLNYQNKT
jgi:hypothetical protein